MKSSPWQQSVIRKHEIIFLIASEKLNQIYYQSQNASYLVTHQHIQSTSGIAHIF